MSEIITLKQEPIIAYQKIESVGAEIQKRIEELNLENQVITEDSLSSAKTTRADLNKEFKVFEEQRKFIKNAVEAPYKEFEEKYKDFIAKHYNNADNLLKTKINAFEERLKKDKENRIRAYFDELAQVENIDFIPFERLNLNITRSTSDKKLKEDVNTFLENVEKDLSLLQSIPMSEEFKTNALFDYKKTLNMSQSIRLAQEREKAKQEELKRQEALWQQEQERREKEPIKEEPKVEILQAPKVEQVETPKVEKTEPLFEVAFKVKGTKQQLKALKEYIISNNIEIL